MEICYHCCAILENGKLALSGAQIMLKPNQVTRSELKANSSKILRRVCNLKERIEVMEDDETTPFATLTPVDDRDLPPDIDPSTPVETLVMLGKLIPVDEVLRQLIPA
jgi:hypothetical protein